MFKKTLAIAALVCTVPAIASASWFLTTQAKNAGGTVVSDNGTQVVTNGAITHSYAAQTLPITATPATGNTLRSLVVTAKGLNALQNYTTVVSNVASGYTIPSPQDGWSYNVAATFQANSLNVTAENNGGTVSPSKLGNVFYGYKLVNPLTFTFAPMAGYTITGITGAPAEATVVVPNVANKAATVTFPAGYIFTTALDLQASAVNNTPSLNRVFPQTVTYGSKVTLAASVNNISGATYSWAYVSGPANTTAVNGTMLTSVPGPALTLNNANTASANFLAPTTAGQYKFLVTEGTTGKTTLATVNVLASSVDSANQCQFCHTANGVAGSTPTDNIGLRYQTSIHAQSTHAACSACHYGTANGAHPGNVNADTVDPTTFKVQVNGVVGGNGNVKNVGDVFCTSCHNPLPHSANLAASVTCINCHTNKVGSATSAPAAEGDAHLIQPLGCTDCHSIAQTNPFSDKNLVGDTVGNNGVRAVMGEFSKWSHHIVNPNGAAPIDEQCAVCHLEGTVGTYGFGVDGNKHMTDNFVHLRNAKTDADMQWDPSAPNHTTMDNFCESCHSATGATSTMNGKLQPLITAAMANGITAGPLNPFGDTISNRYDKMQRPRVTDVDDQFNTGNNSHHAVKGPRYTGRTRFDGQPGGRKIASAATFAANSSAVLQGIRSTIYDAGNFNDLYVPLGTDGTAATGLGDDSTLHCGDCHTVGQWKVGSSVNAAGNPTPAQIGAHGSNNEYMLRNSLGTDERHTQNAYTLSATNVVTQTNPNGAFLVCYNCHAYSKYGSTYVGTGADAGNPSGSELGNIQSHAGEYAQAGRCNGAGNTLPFNGYTTGNTTDGSQFASRVEANLVLNTTAAGYTEVAGNYATGADPNTARSESMNIFGIQCLNCHNSGYGNAYGGIHGSANNTSWNNGTTEVSPDPSVTGGAYIDGAGNTNKVERFLPGLGNAMHVPGTLGGVDGATTYAKGGHISNDTNWEQKHWQQKAGMVINYKTGAVSGLLTASAGAGCYTLGENTTVATDVTKGVEGPSVTGANGAATEAAGTWGACVDHTAAQGAANHGFLKRVVRPVTY